MSELRDLYQEVILDHYKRPRNRGTLGDATCCADGHNRLCGDQIHIAAKVRDGRIEEVRFEGSGCAIATASASLMTEALQGKTVAEAQELFQRFYAVVTGPPTAEIPDMEELGKLTVLAGVREFPVRVKCATLAWHTFLAALKHEHKPVSTE